MAVILFLIITALQIYFGFWTIQFCYRDDDSFKIRVEHIFLSILLGMGFSTVLLLVLDIFFVPLNTFTTLLINGGLAIILYLLNHKYSFFKLPKVDFKLSLFDIIPIIIIVAISIISIWRTIYYPPYSYDSMMGIDLIAKYAERDGSIARSQLFTDIVPRAEISSNQLFYAPFTMLMQTMYRIIGITFGQVWLGLLAFSFWMYFYLICRRKIHPALAQIGVLLLLLAPEYFAYSFILQTDFNNAAYFFIGVYFFNEYCLTDRKGMLYLSMIGMFIACWSRTETIFFVPFGSLYLLIRQYLHDNKKLSFFSLRIPFLYSFIPAVSVIIWSLFYVKFYLPKTANLFGQMGFEFSGLIERFIEIINSMNSVVVFNDIYWGYIVSAFILVLVVSLPLVFIKRRFHGWIILYFILTLYITFMLLIYTFPAVSVQNTFRRGFFKFLPLFAYFIICSPLFIWMHNFLTKGINHKGVSSSLKS